MKFFCKLIDPLLAMHPIVFATTIVFQEEYNE